MDWFPGETKNCVVNLFNSCIVNVLLVFRVDMKVYGVLSMKLHKNETVSCLLHPLFLNACKKKLQSGVHVEFFVFMF